MRFDVITLFPGLFEPFLESGIPGRAVERGSVQVGLHDLREHGEGDYRKVDDAPYGGGGGMILMPGPLTAALDEVQSEGPRGRVVLLSPQGRGLDAATCRRLAGEARLILVCGRYEGVDQRFIDARVDEEISIGDYVLSGGELPAMVLLEAVIRWLPGVLGDADATENDSFSGGLLEGPHYTRPEEFCGTPVPEVLRSGNHAEIQRWRRERAVEITRRRRPDLLRRDDSAADDDSEISAAAAVPGDAGRAAARRG